MEPGNSDMILDQITQSLASGPHCGAILPRLPVGGGGILALRTMVASSGLDACQTDLMEYLAPGGPCIQNLTISEEPSRLRC